MVVIFQKIGIICLFVTLIDIGLIFGNYLEPPGVTASGNWTSWDKCPTDSYISGLSLLLDETSKETHLRSIRFYCTREHVLSESTKDSIFHVNVSNPSEDAKWTEPTFCERGIAVGVQLLTTDQSNTNKFSEDDQSEKNFISNLELICSDEGMLFFDQKKASGLWSIPQRCSPQEGICAAQAQTEVYGNQTLLNSLKFDCCEIPHPASTCKGTDRFEPITECINNEAIVPLTCTFEYFVGISFYGKQTERSIYEDLGFDLSSASSILATQPDFQLQQGEIKISPEISFTPEQSTNQNVTAKPGQKVYVHQIVGHCGFYRIRTPYLHYKTDEKVSKKQNSDKVNHPKETKDKKSQDYFDINGMQADEWDDFDDQFESSEDESEKSPPDVKGSIADVKESTSKSHLSSEDESKEESEKSPPDVKGSIDDVKESTSKSHLSSEDESKKTTDTETIGYVELQATTPIGLALETKTFEFSSEVQKLEENDDKNQISTPVVENDDGWGDENSGEDSNTDVSGMDIYQSTPLTNEENNEEKSSETIITKTTKLNDLEEDEQTKSEEDSVKDQTDDVVIGGNLNPNVQTLSQDKNDYSTSPIPTTSDAIVDFNQPEANIVENHLESLEVEQIHDVMDSVTDTVPIGQLRKSNSKEDLSNSVVEIDRSMHLNVPIISIDASNNTSIHDKMSLDEPLDSSDDDDNWSMSEEVTPPDTNHDDAPIIKVEVSPLANQDTNIKDDNPGVKLNDPISSEDPSFPDPDNLMDEVEKETMGGSRKRVFALLQADDQSETTVKSIGDLSLDVLRTGAKDLTNKIQEDITVFVAEAEKVIQEVKNMPIVKDGKEKIEQALKTAVETVIGNSSNDGVIGEVTAPNTDENIPLAPLIEESDNIEEVKKAGGFVGYIVGGMLVCVVVIVIVIFVIEKRQGKAASTGDRLNKGEYTDNAVAIPEPLLGTGADEHRITIQEEK